jgi:hypothetical protein
MQQYDIAGNIALSSFDNLDYLVEPDMRKTPNRVASTFTSIVTE